MIWNDVFDYENGEIYWKVDRSKNKSWNTANAGRRAGSNMSNGYRNVNFKGKRYLEHRIIWEMHNGEIEGKMEIDHINHIRNDNRIENLRVVDRAENCRNYSKSSNNSSGVAGVYWHKKAGKWGAQIMINYKNYHLGLFKTIEDAAKARLEASIDLNFHENHGL